MQGTYKGVARTETHEVDLDVDFDVEVDRPSCSWLQGESKREG